MFSQLFTDILVSERFAINVIANYYKADTKRFDHLTSRNDQSYIDFTYDGLKYDVKFANPTFSSSTKTLETWDFDIRGKKDYCDYFVLIGMIKQRPQEVFLVPSKGAPIHHIRVSIVGKSKWHQYLIWRK